MFCIRNHISSIFNHGKVNALTYFAKSLSISIPKMEKAMEEISKNPYFDKYADKITKLQKKSPEEFINKAKKIVKSTVLDEKEFSKVSAKPKESKPLSPHSMIPPKKLENIMKIEILKERTAEEISHIWTEHFAKKDAICGTMSVQLFVKIQAMTIKYPMFLFPLPRDQGYEFIYAQFSGNEIHFTPLINYQAYQENAPECLTMIHYPDLASEKGIVLMHGEINKNLLSSKEAQFLANEVTLYYGHHEGPKADLLRKFHENPNAFKHADLIKHIEEVDLSDMAKLKEKPVANS